MTSRPTRTRRPTGPEAPLAPLTLVQVSRGRMAEAARKRGDLTANVGGVAAPAPEPVSLAVTAALEPVTVEPATPFADSVWTPIADEFPAPIVEIVAAPIAEEIPAPIAEDVAAPVAEDVAAPVAAEVPPPIAAESAEPIADEVSAPVADETPATTLSFEPLLLLRSEPIAAPRVEAPPAETPPPVLVAEALASLPEPSFSKPSFSERLFSRSSRSEPLPEPVRSEPTFSEPSFSEPSVAPTFLQPAAFDSPKAAPEPQPRAVPEASAQGPRGVDEFLDYWDDLRGLRAFPALDEINRTLVAAQWKNSLILSFSETEPVMPRITRLGDTDGEIEFTPMVIDWLMSRGKQCARRGSPIEEEHRFPGAKGIARYKLLVLPVSRLGTDDSDCVLCLVTRTKELSVTAAFRRWLAS
jgi:hypothetical protein